jgi:hypothetical protein
LHWSDDPTLNDLTWSARAWSGSSAYADSKLHDLILAFAVARKWPDVLSNAVESGWVATKMGGPGAPDDLDAGAVTQVWLATNDSNRPDAAIQSIAPHPNSSRLGAPTPCKNAIKIQTKKLLSLIGRIGHPQICLITPRRLQKIGPSLNHKAIQIVLYGICRKVTYLVYESPPLEIQRGITQDAVSGTCPECDKQLVQISVGHR